MKKSELIIGNCVYDNDGSLVIIHDGFGIDHAAQFEPIPLTEEWLLKFGFEKNTGDYFLGCFSMRIVGKEMIWFVCNDGDFSQQVKYVHQLQNLVYALTGEELTIK